MEQISIGAGGRKFLYKCPHCKRLQTFGNYMRYHCCWCSEYLPNVAVLVRSIDCRIRHHFAKEYTK